MNVKTFLVLALVCFTSTAHAACNRATLAGNYSASGILGDTDDEIAYFTGRVVLNQGGALQAPIIRITEEGSRESLAGRGSWSVNANCVGTMRLIVNSDDPDDEPILIDFTVAGTEADPIISAILTTEEDPLSGTMTLRRMTLR